MSAADVGDDKNKEKKFPGAPNHMINAFHIFMQDILHKFCSKK